MDIMTDNLYRRAMLITAVVGVILGIILVIAGDPDYGELISPAQALGVVLVNIGIIAGACWLVVSALIYHAVIAEGRRELKRRSEQR